MELKINHRALRLKSILGFFESTLLCADNTGDDLLVLNYHGTPKKFINNFEKQINYLKKNFEIISPDFLNSYYAKRSVKTSKRPLLITFDDGIKNNLFAIEILDKNNIKGIFFVIPDFIDATDASAFYRSNIRPIVDEEIEGAPEDTMAMTWEDLKKIVNKEHFIGSHSKTHIMKRMMNYSQSEAEIIHSKNSIAEKLQIKVENFCSPNDSNFSTGELQMELIKKHYSFFHSTYPGNNSVTRNPYFVRRVNVECYWPLNAVKFAIGRFDKLRFKKQSELFQEVAGKA